MSNIYKDYIPANARMVVDYDKPPKDRVKFAYPKKYTYEQALKKFGYHLFLEVEGLVIIASMFLLFVGVFGFYASAIVTMLVTNPTAFAVLVTKFQVAAVSQCGTAQSINLTQMMQTYFYIGLALIAFFGIPKLLVRWYLKHPEEISEIIPCWNYHISNLFRGRKTLTLLPNMVFNLRVAIPEFHNVYLDYEAEGECSEYLKKVEVLEMPFNFSYLRPNGSLSKKEINEYVWRAFFTFSKTPKTGSIKVIYI